MPDTLPLTAFLLIGASALLLAIGAVPVMRRVALQTGTVDKPSARKIHSRIRCRCSAAPPSTWPSSWCSSSLATGSYINQTVGIFVGATLMSFMGVLDDRWGLGSYVKLARPDVGGGGSGLLRRAGARSSAGGWTL
jgi:UDP-GlcNAc:undecaprenyl-phosphate GlcNAc-1-phosphate transferase